MSTATQELVLTVSHTLRAVLRSVGYRGRRPGRVVALLGVGLVAGDAALTYGVWSLGSGDDAPFYLPTLVVVLVYALGGPAFLTVDPMGTRDSALTRVLQALPLPRAAIRLRLFLTSVSLATVLVLLGCVPAMTGLAAGGLDVAVAVGVVVAALALSIATVTTCVAVFRAVLPAHGWQQVALALTMLVFVGVVGISMVGVVERGLLDLLVVQALGMPSLLGAVAAGEIPTPATLGVLIGSATALTALAVGLQMLQGRHVASREVTAEWRPGAWAPGVIGELRLALRNPVLCGNLIGALLVNTAIAVALLCVSPGTRDQLIAPFVSVMALLAGIAPRLLRGVHTLRPPQALYAGGYPSRWVRLLDVVAGVLFLIGGLPILVAVAGSGSWAVLTTASVGIALLSAIGAAVLLMWALPLRVDEPTGQLLAMLSLATVQSVPLLIVSTLGDGGVLVAAAVTAVLLVGAAASGPVVEPGRWNAYQPTSP